MTDTPSPFAPFVTATELAAALGTSRSTLLRHVTAGAVPKPEGKRRKGRHRRWSLTLAASIVRAAGREVPKEWTTTGGAA